MAEWYQECDLLPGGYETLIDQYRFTDRNSRTDYDPSRAGG
jgi:hypothetical protein